MLGWEFNLLKSEISELNILIDINMLGELRGEFKIWKVVGIITLEDTWQ